MFGIGLKEIVVLIIVLIIVLWIAKSSKENVEKVEKAIPKSARMIGTGVRELKKGLSEIPKEFKEGLKDDKPKK